MKKMIDLKWRKYNGAIIPDYPPHLIKETLPGNIKKRVGVLKGVYFARWVSNFDCPKETDFWYVIKDESGGMDELKSNTRNEIRKGEKHFDVIKINKDQLLECGYSVYVAAMKAYNSKNNIESHSEFKNNIIELNETKYDFWGVFIKGKHEMVAYSINKVEYDQCHYDIIRFHPEYFKMRPSEVLIFSMNEYYLNERKVKYINDGARSIRHQTNFQDYLIRKFGFRRAYCKLHILYSWQIRGLIMMVFPLRKILKRIHSFRLLNEILRQEEIRRSFD